MLRSRNYTADRIHQRTGEQTPRVARRDARVTDRHLLPVVDQRLRLSSKPWFFSRRPWMRQTQKVSLV